MRVATMFAWEGKLVPAQFTTDQNEFFLETLAVEKASQIASSKGEGCKKELASAILLNTFSAARKMQLQEALNKT